MIDRNRLEYLAKFLYGSTALVAFIPSYVPVYRVPLYVVPNHPQWMERSNFDYPSMDYDEVTINRFDFSNLPYLGNLTVHMGYGVKSGVVVIVAPMDSTID